MLSASGTRSGGGGGAGRETATAAESQREAVSQRRWPPDAQLRVLIVKPCCMGDVLMATPLAASLARALPRAAIDWAVGEHSRAVLVGNPDVAQLLDATGCVKGALSVRRIAGLASEIRSRRYDAVFVPDRSPVLALIVAASLVPVRVGLDSGGRGRPYTVRVPVGRGVRHETEVYLDLARAVGLPTASARPVFAPSESDRGAALEALGVARGAGRGGGIQVVVHPSGGVNPGMSLPEKRWPPARFARVMDRLVETREATVVLVGGPDDVAVSRQVLHAASELTTSSTVDLTSRLSIGETAALIETSDLYVGNDSGVAHLASAVGTPVVVVFGPTDPRRYGPVPGAGLAVAPSPDDGAVVDRLSEARGSTAIEAVSVEDVWRAVDSLLPAA